MRNVDETKKHAAFSCSSSPPLGASIRQSSSSSSRSSRNEHQAAAAPPLPPPRRMESAGAVFRSVSMGVVEPPSLLSHPPEQFSTAIKQQPFGGLYKSHSTPIAEDQPPSSIQLPAKNWVWKLGEDEVLAVPLYHPMERTARRFQDLPLLEITKRISGFLKEQSIPAEYSVGGRVTCISDNGTTDNSLVKFIIQLWKTTEGHFIVEVQRCQGCCFAMQTIRHELLEAIQSGLSVHDSNKQTPHATCDIVQSLMEQLTNKLKKPEASADSCTVAALELAEQLLDSDRLDSQKLGLESLCSLTNPTQVMLCDIDQVSRALLTGNDTPWQDRLGRYFEAEASAPKESQSVDFDTTLSFLALKVLTQAVESLSYSFPSSSNDKISLNFDKISLNFHNSFWTRVLHSLHYQVTVATQRPLEACLAIRCLRHLHTLQPQTLNIPLTMHQGLGHARVHGIQHHRSLQQESEEWMGGLGIAY